MKEYKEAKGSDVNLLILFDQIIKDHPISLKSSFLEDKSHSPIIPSLFREI